MNSNEKKQTLSKLPPLIAKFKPITKTQNDRQLESDGNYFITIIINLINIMKKSYLSHHLLLNKVEPR